MLFKSVLIFLLCLALGLCLLCPLPPFLLSLYLCSTTLNFFLNPLFFLSLLYSGPPPLLLLPLLPLRLQPLTLLPLPPLPLNSLPLLQLSPLSLLLQPPPPLLLLLSQMRSKHLLRLLPYRLVLRMRLF